jgi:CheY-like chemotaxis protein
MSDQALFLLVEDEERDIHLIRGAFLKAKIVNPLYVVRSGEEAVAYLRGEGRYGNRTEYPLPALVLLDLRLPGMDGYGVLRWIRGEPGLRNLRVLVLTGFGDMRDANVAYQAGANSFLVKPMDFQRFVEISQALGGYWVWTDKVPEGLVPAAVEVAAVGRGPLAPEGVRPVELPPAAVIAEVDKQVPPTTGPNPPTV